MSTSARFSAKTAVAVVIANMIGTGVFTSLGFQLVDIQSPFVLILLWIVGGIAALCGAFCYAELGAALPRSGGEYHFLTQLYHPALGFTSGWISATVGFAAPTALAAITFSAYLATVYPAVPQVTSASILVIVAGMAHALNHRTSGRFQQAFTLLKLILILGFCGLALALVESSQPVNFLPISGDLELALAPAFAVALVYVNYAYTGWNAATYISSELEDAQRSLPWVLVTGTVTVMVLYVLLNAVFLTVAPMNAMEGELEVGFIAAHHAFGQQGAEVMGIVFAALLISTVSAMILAGPRVLHAIGEDFSGLKMLAVTSQAGVPVVAIGVQVGITLAMIWTSSFQSILLFTGFVLALNTFFAVAGVFILRIRESKSSGSFTMPLFPAPPLIYLALTGWTMVFIGRTHPEEVIWALGLVGVGILLYLLTSQIDRAKRLPEVDS